MFEGEPIGAVWLKLCKSSTAITSFTYMVAIVGSGLILFCSDSYYLVGIINYIRLTIEVGSVKDKRGLCLVVRQVFCPTLVAYIQTDAIVISPIERNKVGTRERSAERGLAHALLYNLTREITDIVGGEITKGFC